MPIYEYQCQACGLRHEALQKMSDDPLTDCPDCGEPQLKKLVSAAAFRLKGGGWYETDFKKSNKKNLVEGESGNGKKAESTDNKPSDTGSAAKTSTGDSTSTSSSAKPAKSADTKASK